MRIFIQILIFVYKTNVNFINLYCVRFKIEIEIEKEHEKEMITNNDVTSR